MATPANLPRPAEKNVKRIARLERSKFVIGVFGHVPPQWPSTPPCAPTRASSYSNADLSPMTGLRLDDSSRIDLPLAVALLASRRCLRACAKKQDRPPRQVATVSVVQARRASVPYVIEANGVVTPLQSVAVTPQVDGIITSVDFQEGQDVRAGQPLFHIDPRPYQNAYEQAAAVLARDSATAANAKGELERYQKLLAAKVDHAAGRRGADDDGQHDRGNGPRRSRGGGERPLQPREHDHSRADLRQDGQPAREARQSRSLRQRRAARRDQPGAPDPRALRDSVVAVAADPAVRRARAGLPVSAVAGGVAPASPSIDSLASAVDEPGQDPIGGQSGSLRGGVGGPNAGGDGSAPTGAAVA